MTSVTAAGDAWPTVSESESRGTGIDPAARTAWRLGTDCTHKRLGDYLSYESKITMPNWVNAHFQPAEIASMLRL